MKGRAVLTDGVLRLDGKNSYAVVPDSAGMHLTEKGYDRIAPEIASGVN